MAAPDLQTIWCEDDPAGLKCLICRSSFDTEALVRTFKIRHGSAEQATHSKEIKSYDGQTVVLFDRHLKCLLEAGIPFAAVSHVWDPDVSLTQQHGKDGLQAEGVVRLAHAAPARIYQGFHDDPGTGDFEFWHDYYSVPQWCDVLKGNILLSIHEIFARANTVVVYFEDVSPETVRRLYHGTSSEERIQGITGVCNAKWFKRIWTAMELIRSGDVRMMTSDCKLAAAVDDPAFLKTVDEVWNDELKRYPSIYHLEAAAEIHQNMVPWNLGPLLRVKQSKRTNFAQAFALLSKRGCRDETDFLHAFRGIVVGTTPRFLEKGYWPEFMRTARECLLAGDCSPLLMAPAIPMEDPRLSSWTYTHAGYNEVWTWELGEETSPFTFADQIRIDESGETVSLRLEKIGLVSKITLAPSHWNNPEDNLGWCAFRVLALTGPHVEEFVGSLGERLYGESSSFIMSKMEEKGQTQKLQVVLDARSSNASLEDWQTQGEDGSGWLAKAMSLSDVQDGRYESRLWRMAASFGTMHCNPYHYIADITCVTCQRTSIFRLGAFVPVAELQGAMAYRIPGLQYHMALRDGMALLVKEGRIVGRMMWATPACPCRESSIVQVSMPEFPPPRPRDQNRQTTKHDQSSGSA